MWRAGLLAAIGLGCRAPVTAPLAPAGARGIDNEPSDEGAGGLARASSRFLTDEPDASPPPASPARFDKSDDADDPPDEFGGDAYGGTTYANWRAPTFNTAPNRTPRYNVSGDLRGVIEGSVSWGGAVPRRLATSCGTIENPTVHVAADKALGGVLVYIDRVSIGRNTMPGSFSKPPSVGGSVVKHGCALIPAMQIATPLPVQLALHSDARTTLRVTSPAGAAKPYDLQEGGRAFVQLATGVTRVDGADGDVTPAWVVAIDTPYFAITDDTGRFRLDELAPGTYDVTFWQAPIVTETGGKLAYGAPVVAHRTISVTAAKPARATVVLGR